MIDSIHRFSNQLISFPRGVIRSLTDSHQKRIFLIAAFAFAALAAITFRHYKHMLKVKNLPQKVKTLPMEALNLMNDCCRLGWRSLDPTGKENHYNKIKKIINELSAEEINEKIYFCGGMKACNQTLLLQAIMYIPDDNYRLKIVLLLLEKGAKPNVSVDQHSPLDEARKTNDPLLIRIINDRL